MPTNSTVNIPANEWVLLTPSDVSAVRIQNQSGAIIHIKGASGAVAPNSIDGSFMLLPYSAIAADITLADIFGGISGVNRVYCYSTSQATVSVSHG